MTSLCSPIAVWRDPLRRRRSFDALVPDRRGRVVVALGRAVGRARRSDRKDRSDLVVAHAAALFAGIESPPALDTWPIAPRSEEMFPRGIEMVVGIEIDRTAWTPPPGTPNPQVPGSNPGRRTCLTCFSMRVLPRLICLRSVTAQQDALDAHSMRTGRTLWVASDHSLLRDRADAVAHAHRAGAPPSVPIGITAGRTTWSRRSAPESSRQ
jgi:hypothetical protein